jgi:Na+/melibiose symporter-like transporter
LSVRDSRDESAPRRLDLVGAAIVAVAVAVLSIAVDRGRAWGWGSGLTIGGFVLAACLFVAFVIIEPRARVPLVDLKLFRNLPYVLVTAMGAVSNIGYAVTVFGATLYLQLVRGLAPLTAGVVFLAPSVLVALSGPIGARLGKRFRPAAVMAAAGLLSGAGLLALTFAHAWVLYVLAFSVAGLGFGLGWTFVNVGTQDVVRPERAGEASGVVLTIVVTAGGVGIAAAASAIAQLEASGTSTHDAIDGTLRVIALLVIASAAVVMAVRAQLVRRGLMAPLSMDASWTPPSD